MTTEVCAVAKNICMQPEPGTWMKGVKTPLAA